ncbi:hypothetical protein ACIRTB_21075 [Streptomyces sp. NPDC101158]|uniref:hypothetical protein n=1 Tax=Streptomyces sp. NPDC101158 TaxID=3366117 RepID=UPI0037F7ACDE
MITSPNRVRAVVVVAATAAALVAAVPFASAAPYTDFRDNACGAKLRDGRCRLGTVVEYWHAGGARGIGWVYSSKKAVAKASTHHARWTYKTPGKAWKTGAGWTKARVTKGSNGYFAEAWWGRGGHTGPKAPKGTIVCTQYKGEKTNTCLTLK